MILQEEQEGSVMIGSASARGEMHRGEGFNGPQSDGRLAEKAYSVKKTNFDKDLDEQLKNPEFATRFERAREAWDVALQIAALRRQAGLSQKDLAKLLKVSQQHQPSGITGL